MKIYNSMTNKKEEFKSLIPNKVSMYVCGPTVYNYIHIGNARPMIVFDTFRRLFEALNYEVMFISNYTDVDDKIIKVAQELNVSESDITSKFIEAYENDRKSLHTIMPEYRPKVTEYMSEIINFISELIEKDYAYEINGDVYFRISKLENYGKLSNLNIEDLQVGARIEKNEDKESPLDFTLWKKTNVGINWKSPWSMGRPGWHTECVVMISSINNGNMIDIHGGGMDLKFPHHENEIAQANGCFNHNIANYWIHNGFINVDDEKMSKSIGNVKWTKDVVAAVGANVFRLAMLSTHYRAPLNFSEELIESTQKELMKIETVLKQVNLVLSINDYQLATAMEQKTYDEFIEYMKDDLNTSNAMKVIFEVVKKLNQELRAKETNFELIAMYRNSLLKMLEIFGVFIELVIIDKKIIQLYNDWLNLKSNKDFESADKLRTQLVELKVL